MEGRGPTALTEKILADVGPSAGSRAITVISISINYD